jgi:glyoxylase-like metal-dependent hydrolase (beta-lactamase superfamily II)
MTNPINGVSRIEVPTPFPVGNVNCYLIEGSLLTLIDTGPKTSEGLATIQKELEDRSYTMSDVEQILLTHGHLDHAGLTAEFVRARQIDHGTPTEVWIHSKDADVLLNYEQYAESFIESYEKLIGTSGVPEEEVRVLNPKKLIKYYKSIRASVPTASQFNGKTSFKTGIGELEAVWTPGHSSGSVCYVCDKQKVIFSGDHILGDISSNPSISFDDPERIGMLTYLESLDHISSRTGYIALPGHRTPISDIKSRIETLHAEYEEKFRTAAESLTSTPQTIYEISRTLYGDYDLNSLVLALAESQDVLRILESRNQARLITKKGIVWAVKKE